MSERTDNLYARYGWNDLVRNKAVTAALVTILTLSAFLMGTGSMVMERLVGSVNQLFDQAKPPHFLQMHKGGYDPAALEAFAAQRPEIDAWLIEDMLGFDSAAIAWYRPATGEVGDFSSSLIDNLFVTQNEQFDFLIDQTGTIARPAIGEVFVPVAYQQRFGLRAGDVLRIQTDSGVQDVTVEGFVRDSQMASSLSSATRFVVAPGDFEALAAAGGGSPEIIVEYRLSDLAALSDFQRAYESTEALPRNGQAVTFEMIRMINAFSDGLVAIALVFVSLLLIAIALLNLRFVIRGTLEDEVRQIGAMKAIGLPDKDISGLYLTKYSLMTLFACVVGGALAVGATNLLTRSIQANYATAPVGWTTFVVPLVALALVYLIVMGICRGVLRGVRRIEVVNALVHGSTLDERATARRTRRQARQVRSGNLAASGSTDMNRRLAFLDLRADAGQWVLIPIVFALATVLVVLPTNLLSTFSSPRFVTYMGAPQTDLRADLQFTDDLDQVRDAMLAEMGSDTRLREVRSYASVLHEARGAEGWEAMPIEVGDYAGETVAFLSGGRPAAGQVALSVLNADKYGLVVGDTLALRRAGSTFDVEVSGIYQDVTSGGHTAKMQGEVTSGAARYVLYADTVEGVDAAAVASDYHERFASAAVIPMREYVQQTLSYVTDAFRSAAVLALVFGLGVAALITSLFLKLRLTRERQRMGVLSAVGFSAREIGGQVRLKTLVTVVAGVALGLLLAATVGESLVGAFISLAGLGIAELAFIPNPWVVYLAYPLALIAAGYLAAVVLTARLRGTDKSSWLRG